MTGRKKTKTEKVKIKDITSLSCGWPGCTRSAPYPENPPLLPPGWRMLIVARETVEVSANVPAGAVLITPDAMEVDRQLCPEHVRAFKALLVAGDHERSSRLVNRGADFGARS